MLPRAKKKELIHSIKVSVLTGQEPDNQSVWSVEIDNSVRKEASSRSSIDALIDAAAFVKSRLNPTDLTALLKKKKK